MKRQITSLVFIIPMIVNLFMAAPGLGTASAAALPAYPTTVQTDPGLPIYLDTSYSFEERAADLVSRMTLAEKAAQMNSSRAPAIARLGIREYGWWNEALHGVSRLQLAASGNATTLNNTTSYPIDMSLGASWDPELMYREATMISDEAREVVPDNRLNLDFWSPTINLARDPRWGRNDESYGEDPYLTTQIVSQFVNGMEGKDMNGNLLPEGSGYLKTVTTLKHYAANNSEVNRRTGSSDMDERTLREYYTAAFRDIVRQAGNNSVMSSYNSINGTPTSASVYLLDRLLRLTWGFRGYITSDCDSIMDISQSHRWIPPGWSQQVTQVERMAFAMTAGVDLDCNAGYTDNLNYGNTVPTAISQNITTQTGRFTANDVDTALLRLFTARMQLGEFDDPNAVPWVVAARERVPQGSWVNSNANNAVTETPERLAMAREVGAKSLVLLKNSESTRKDGSTGKLLPMQVPASGAYNVAVIGYFANPNSMYLGGYSSTQGSAGNAKSINAYNGIRNAILAINPDATVTYYKGFTGTGTSAASLTTVDPAAITAAAAADLVIVYTGTDSGTADEAGDRKNINLPGAQAELIQQAGQANPNTVAVMETIGMVDVTAFEPYVSAILWSCYNGQRKGDALADVLLGAYNPSGHLPFIWYQSESQIPEITDYTLRPTETNPGRTYMYFNGPLSYPFGYGLSYSTFSFSNLQIDRKELDANDTFQVSVDVTNTGELAGAEVVQLYVNTPDAAAELERPIKRLKGFQKVTLEPGETKTVSLAVKVADLAFFDEAAGKYMVDNGRYGVQVSTSSADADIQLQDFIQVSGSLNPVIKVVTVRPAQEGDEAQDIPNRVIFQEGKVILPKVSVAMSDESLYGYILKGASVPLPDGMTVAYSTNRPEVVSIDADGTIRTGQSGVATVTATVSYQGESQSDTFAVRVLADTTLSSLKVNGKPVSSYTAGSNSISMIVPSSETAVPQVEASAANPNAALSITQATGVPGTATITVTAGVDQSVITVAFARPLLSDEFDGSTLGPQWSWVREDPAAWSLTTNPGSMTITAQTGNLTGATNTAKNLLLTDAGGDWTVESKLAFSVAPGSASQQGGMIVYQNDDNYLKVAWERVQFGSFGFTAFQQLVETNGATATALAFRTVPANNPVWLRIIKSGDRYTTSYSLNGTSFTQVGTAQPNFSNVKVGLYTYNGDSTATNLNVAFDYFHTTQTGEVVNTHPVVTLTGPATAKEGQPAHYTFTTSDEDAGLSMISQGCSENGTLANASFDANSGAGSFDCTFHNGPASSPVSVQVADTYGMASDTSSLVVEVSNSAPAVSNNLPAQDVQYTDLIQPVTVTGQDMAADLPLSAATQWSQDGGEFQPGLPEWLALSSQPCTADGIQGACVWNIASTGPVPAGASSYVVRAVVSDGLDESSTDIAITVKPEDALIQYTGETIAQIGNELQLRATVWDSAAAGYAGASPESGEGATLGDVTKMWIAFDIYPMTSCLIGTPVTKFAQVSDGETAGDGIGAASAAYTSSAEASFCVVARLVGDASGGANGWYSAGNAEIAAITFYQASGQYATGGGWITDPDGAKGNLGFNARYNKKGQAQGQMVYMYRGMYQGEEADFIIRSNAINALMFDGAAFPISATLQGKATIQVNRASDGLLLFSEGNATFQASVVDSGQNGADKADSFAITVYRKNGVLYKSVPATTLQGGNVVAHQ